MRRFYLLLCLLFVFVFLFGCRINSPYKPEETQPVDKAPDTEKYFSYYELSPFDGTSPYVAVNGNVPYFTEEELVTFSYEDYGKLDNMGRCTVVCANVGTDLMPTEPRGSIGSVKPSGWQLVKYDCVDGKYLYNRCHLIGYQLTGENANECNLITGTRYLNVQGMLPFENMVSDYVKETENHVLYRVTPVFLEDELVARGVLMEGLSVEDSGEGICFNVFCYNVQPDIEIDYSNGDSRYNPQESQEENVDTEYVLNTSSKKFHYPYCSSVGSISSHNKETYSGSREALMNDGYTPCGSCKP